MFSPTTILQKAFVKELSHGYQSTFGKWKSNYGEIISWAGNIASEIIANSNAVYHNVEHTMIVSLVGQAILKGKHIKEGGVTCEDWLNTMVSLLFHDIGYVRGICKDDNEELSFYATGRKKNEVIELGEGCTDASLAPYHIERGKLFLEERFGGNAILNCEQMKKNIELTGFPIPSDSEPTKEFTFPELVRSADLIGQLGDARYIQKCAALYYEFEEIGANEKFGYSHPEEMIENYPKFFWSSVYKFIKPSIKYLKATTEGKYYLNGLYANIFSVEHDGALMDSNLFLDYSEKVVVRTPSSPRGLKYRSDYLKDFNKREDKEKEELSTIKTNVLKRRRRKRRRSSDKRRKLKEKIAAESKSKSPSSPSSRKRKKSPSSPSRGKVNIPKLSISRMKEDMERRKVKILKEKREIISKEQYKDDRSNWIISEHLQEKDKEKDKENKNLEN